MKKRLVIAASLFLFLIPFQTFAGPNVWTSLGLFGGDVISVVINPSDPATIYAIADGEREDSLYKSTDGGNNWKKIYGNEEILLMAIDPQNSGTIYVGTHSNLSKSIDSGQNWITIFTTGVTSFSISPENSDILYLGSSALGLFKCTDGGAQGDDSWEVIYEHLPFTFIALNPLNSSVIYIATDSRIYKSTDGGQSFQEITSNIGLNFENIKTIAINSVNTNIVYVVTLWGGILKTIDGGINWSQIMDNDSITSLVIDPSTPSTIYAGSNQGIYKTSDSGESWGMVNTGLLNQEVRQLDINPNNPSILYAATAGGVHKTSDNGGNWAVINNGINNLKINCMAVDPVTTAILYAGTASGLYKSPDFGVSWALIKSGRIKSLAVNPLNTSILYTCITGEENGLFRSNDAGQSWEESSIDSIKYVALDPQNPQVLYAGNYGNNYKSTDGGDNWTLIDGLNQSIRFMKIDPIATSNLYAVYSGALYTSTNSGGDWTYHNLPGSNVTSLAIDPISPSTLYIGSSSYDWDESVYRGVYKSKDDGKSWTNFDIGLANDMVWCLAILPHNSPVLFAGTNQNGVYRKEGAASWNSIGYRLPNTQILDLVVDLVNPDTIYAGTSDAGVYKITLFPLIGLSREKLYFGSTTGGLFSPGQKVLIENLAGGDLNWNSVTQHDWITVNPTYASESGLVEICVNPLGLAEGTYEGKVDIIDVNASNSPQTITIELNVYDQGSSSLPFGFFDTPSDGTAGITGAIPITGWALDDVEVTKVEIWMDSVAGEAVAGNLVYIGDGIFIEGARPDVEQAYPSYPLNSRAGWGYMMLTNSLPNQGNGTYNIHAYAFDSEGNQHLLGTKTITCDNAHATKPFGAIDTPSQGGAVSGSQYKNYGWALTPLPNFIPDNGSTINVWIDGLSVGNPVYNLYRNDIATLFPSYANSDGAVGYYLIDTTKYLNGVHTIAWSVADNAANVAGIGSRYFTIYNSGITGNYTRLSSQMAMLENTGDDSHFIRFKRGFRVEKDSQELRPDGRGVYPIQIYELERLEMCFGHKLVEGYMRVGEELRPLPIGSTLDAERGVFYWQPGPGFIGSYDLVFIRRDEYGIQRRMNVKVKIRPKFGIYNIDFFKNSKAKVAGLKDK